jgi:hypothetical protein
VQALARLVALANDLKVGRCAALGVALGAPDQKKDDQEDAKTHGLSIGVPMGWASKRSSLTILVLKCIINFTE